MCFKLMTVMLSDSNVNEAHTAQTMFMANLSSADHVYDKADPSYDSDILSEVYDHDQYQDVVCEHHEEHEMYDDVQPNYVVDSHADYTSDSNMIPYDQYVKDNAVPVVQTRYRVDNSLTAKLATYKEQVELYERRARFKLMEREQKINEQLRIVITDRNIKEENLKKELHFVKLQLASTINHNKSMVEEVTSLKKDFKQKENKYLEEFLDMKALKEKVKDKLYKQDQSLQTVHMLCKPKPYYDELNKVDIGYKNPLCLSRAKQVQPALYNGHEIIKTNHVPAIVHNSEDTLEIAEITRKKMNDKIKNPEYLIKMKAEALKTQATASRPIKALTVYPPNTPATLVPRVLPTKSQENIDDEIERKNLLIANDNLIVDCLSKEVFYVATNSELNVSSFTEMHDAHTSLKARCLELEVELSNLRDKIQKDNHTELVKRFSNLEVNHLNLQLKYQNLKESFGNNTSPPARDVPDFDSVFVIEKMKASIQGKDNAIKKLRMQISQLKETRSEADRTLDFRTLDFQITQLTEKINDHVKPKVLAPGKYAIDVEPIPPRNRNNREVHLVYLKHLKESVETLREIVEEAKVERPLDSSLASACRYTKHSQELLEYVIGTYQKKKRGGCVKDLKDKLSDIDSILDKGGVNDDILLARTNYMNLLLDAKAADTRDYIQKAKIQWAVEGDENSKFFHGIVNRKRANLTVKGIMVDGVWVDEPSRVKKEFRDHFAARFQDPGICHGKLNFSFPNRLSSEQVAELEIPISKEEIRNAVWGCGENKSPGPDGFTFEFFRKYWHIVGTDFCLAVEWFFNHDSFSVGCNSSFIALIPKSLDPKLDVLHSFGFGVKWRSWIKGCLSSSMASILVNGSPTSEFQFHRGLKQGDPLAPYLFILIMESLHLSFSRVIDAGIFTGVRIDASTMISHLFYADDAVFIGEWSQTNIRGIMHTLHCFSLLSGLSINIRKSNLLGVGVPSSQVLEAANSLGCSVMKMPFKYLGINVGGNNSLIKAWDESINKLKTRLSKWKLKTLSIGGRLTLLKSVLGSTPIYNMSLYKVPKAVLSSMEAIRRDFFNGSQDMIGR
ncbi:retrovirus-related pol polyprotein from transposon TNT 1-94 [Tanacetum coccineum]